MNCRPWAGLRRMCAATRTSGTTATAGERSTSNRRIAPSCARPRRPCPSASPARPPSRSRCRRNPTTAGWRSTARPCWPTRPPSSSIRVNRGPGLCCWRRNWPCSTSCNRCWGCPTPSKPGSWWRCGRSWWPRRRRRVQPLASASASTTSPLWRSSNRRSAPTGNHCAGRPARTRVIRC